MSPVFEKLLDVLLELAFEELRRRFPNLPVAWLQSFSRELVQILIGSIADPVQREAEIRALYAKIQSLLDSGEVK